MLGWILRKIDSYRAWKRTKKELSAENFKNLAKEIREIAQLSGKLWIEDQNFQVRLKRIQKEMDQLDNLLGKRGFEQLSSEKKQELKKSLQISRDELLKCLHSAPCPTDRIQ